MGGGARATHKMFRLVTLARPARLARALLHRKLRRLACRPTKAGKSGSAGGPRGCRAFRTSNWPKPKSPRPARARCWSATSTCLWIPTCAGAWWSVRATCRRSRSGRRCRAARSARWWRAGTRSSAKATMSAISPAGRSGSFRPAATSRRSIRRWRPSRRSSARSACRG